MPPACNFIKNETATQVFFYKFGEISKNTYFVQHIWNELWNESISTNKISVSMNSQAPASAKIKMLFKIQDQNIIVIQLSLEQSFHNISSENLKNSLLFWYFLVLQKWERKSLPSLLEIKSMVWLLIQLRFCAYCLILAWKNFSTKDLCFHPYAATSIYYLSQIPKITGHKERYLFF